MVKQEEIMEMPCNVYRICYRDGCYFSVSAKLIDRRGSWWHVEHQMGDGSTKIKAYNGGLIRGLKRMHLTVQDAWLAEIWMLGVDISVAEALGNNSQRLKATEKLQKCAECMWDEAIEWGRLIEQVEAK